MTKTPKQAPPFSPPVDPPKVGHPTAALTLGIVGASAGLIPLLFFVSLPCGVLALIFGIKTWHTGHGKAGAILGGIAVALAIIGLVIVGMAVQDVDDAVDEFGTYSECIDRADTLNEMAAC